MSLKKYPFSYCQVQDLIANQYNRIILLMSIMTLS